MGTVGLNFGSPTSGQGFDVSATVSSIVSNLQNVETPWKTQLTALQSQDTAISSLGTLFSTLSNDLSQLTDLQGIMAQKTGSSSNTNVLQLTAASSAATAGAHTVTVGNLATTYSGSLTPIASSVDKLAGAITLQVGSGTAQTITLSSKNNTLAGLAAAINASGVGVTASVLTDSSGSRLSLVSGISGAGGRLSVSSTITDTSNSGAALGYSQSVKGVDASLSVDGINLTSSSNTVTDLIPGVTFQLLSASAVQSDGSLAPVQVVIGNDNASVESAISTMVNDYNSLIGAVNAQEGKDSSGNYEPLFGSPTLSLLQQQLMTGLNSQNPNGYLDAISTNTNTTLAGSITIQVGSGTAQTVTLDPSDNTLSGLADAINAAKIGVTASVATKGTHSTLTLLSRTAGPSGSLTVTSNIAATSATMLDYSGTAGSGTQNSSGSLSAIPSAADALSGSVTIQIGGGTAHTVAVDSSNPTLAGFVTAITNANIGVTAQIVTNSDGSSSLALTSGTAGSAGTLAVTSRILDTTNSSSTDLNYTNSSDISGLSGLGISISQSANGTLSLDVAKLVSALNSDFSGVTGFFQNANSWGGTFATILNNAGSTSATGILKLAANANSSNESALNANISKEESMISAQRVSLMAELNSANQIMQMLPTQLNGVNELYSAISGYNQNKG